MDCQEITGRAKRGCDLGKCRGDTAGREGNCCEVPEDRECRGHQKHCSKPRPRAKSYCHLTLDKQWSGQCSLCEVYEMRPLACSPWHELGAEAWVCGEVLGVCVRQHSHAALKLYGLR